jgi:hypothetical protein
MSSDRQPADSDTIVGEDHDGAGFDVRSDLTVRCSGEG